MWLYIFTGSVCVAARGDEDRHRQFVEAVDEGDQPAAGHAGQDQRQLDAAEHRPARGAERPGGPAQCCGSKPVAAATTRRST
jgi:hypothetical protein